LLQQLKYLNCSGSHIKFNNAMIYSNQSLFLRLALLPYLKKMKNKEISLPDEIVLNKIYLIRGYKVMLDSDLAKLYGVETKVLKQSVKRNLKRFPEDFMFEMTEIELQNWRSQFVTSNSLKMGLRYKPYCFTKHGVLMLSSVLNNERAIEINIQIMRVFTKIRQMLMDNTDLRLIMETLEKKTDNNTKNIEILFRYFDELLEKEQKPRKKIRYKV